MDRKERNLNNNYLLSDASDVTDTSLPDPDKNHISESIKTKVDHLGRYQIYQMDQIDIKSNRTHYTQFPMIRLINKIGNCLYPFHLI
jgi:hypothetical protein